VQRRDRTDWEQFERERLAPYAQTSADSRGRLHPEDEPPYRTAFQRDRDRILHCRAFRRLQYKTQVFVNHEGDHHRTRLTHTMETAQIARTIARALALNEDLTEAVALAHDLGHPPFGHSGEEVLDELMRGHGGFEHNAHSLRVVQVLEHPFPGFAGLNLTREVLECLSKHRTRAAAGSPAPAGQPPLEGQVVDLCDSIAYDHHDLEDGLAAGMIRLEDLDGLEIWRQASADVSAKYGPLSDKFRARRTVKAVIELFVSDALDNTLRRIDGFRIGSPDDARAAAAPAVRFSDAMIGPVAELEQFLFRRVYRHYRVMRMAGKAGRFMRQLFAAYLECPAQLPPDDQERIPVDGLHRTLCDYMAAMTDRYCQDEFKKLFEPFERV